MIMIKKTIPTFLLLFILMLPLGVYSQRTANQILNGLYNKSMTTKDYSADAHIRVDLPFIRMLPVDATIYYKQPDKFRMKSKGIAILPRQGFSDFSKSIRDTNSFTAFISGYEILSKTNATIINFIPGSDTSDLILGKLWIDANKNLVLKSQLTTKSNGTILIEYFYISQIIYGLPDSMIFTVDVKKFKMPKGVTADINNTGTKDSAPAKDPKRGKIFIRMRNYKVNKGLADSIFN